MNIGQAATETRLPAKTIRYYEDIELAIPACRENVYREYSDNDAHRQRFPQRTRSLGFTIEVCGMLLSLYDDKSRAKVDVKAIALGKIDEIDRKIKELRSLCLTLAALAQHSRGDERPECLIIDDLSSRNDQ